MRLLAEMYPEHRLILGFEPQSPASVRCYEATKKYPRMIVCNSGLLADKRIHEKLPMGEFGTDACSMLGASREQGEGIFTDAYVNLAHDAPFDLFVMNLEGYEYQLLWYLAQKGPGYIRSFAVQFHVKYEVSKEETIKLFLNMISLYGTPIYEDYPRWVYWSAA